MVGSRERSEPPVASAKRATEIANLIEADLMHRGWPVGEVIGTFAELIDRYGASRAVVREAIGLLEHKMVVEIRHGPGGGIEVRAPIGEAVVGSISSYLDHTGVTDIELSELRRLLMGLATRFAAERIDEAGIERLRAVVDRPSQLDAESPAAMINSLEVLRTITELSENPALALFWSGLIQRIAAGFVGGFMAPREIREEIARNMTEIVNLVVAGDGSAAEARMIDFFTVLYADVGAPAERVGREEAAAVTGMQSAIRDIGISMPDLDRDRRKKLPARVVRQIVHEIRDHGLQPGDVLGMEQDLLTRLGVSRSVFREAVRIVEFYGLAEMRRGPKGGLTVREPDPRQIEDIIIRYLDFMGIERHHLIEIRVALEVMNLERVLKHAHDRLPELTEVVDRERDGEVQLRRLLEFHHALAELSGNRASRLLSNVLSRQLSRMVDRMEEQSPVTPEEAERLFATGHEDHLRIVEAILAGDVGLARHRMVRHLQGIHRT